MRSNRTKKGTAGVTLVEILIALCVLSIAVLSLFAVNSDIFRSSIDGWKKVQAVLLAQNTMEQALHSPEALETPPINIMVLAGTKTMDNYECVTSVDWVQITNLTGNKWTVSDSAGPTATFDYRITVTVSAPGIEPVRLVSVR